MKRVYIVLLVIVLLVCMVFFIGYGDKVEDSVEDDKISQPQNKAAEEKSAGSQMIEVDGQSADQEILPQVNEDVKQETARESRPVELRPVERTRRQPVPGVSAFEREKREDPEKELAKEQHEKKVEELSELLDKITDEYYDSDDEEDLDYDMLLERFRDELPEEMRYDIPEEILEEIEWWTD